MGGNNEGGEGRGRDNVLIRENERISYLHSERRPSFRITRVTFQQRLVSFWLALHPPSFLIFSKPLQLGQSQCK
jgi:hypothetical protein